MEAVGTRVHRQLIMRMLRISANDVSSILSGLSGIIDEYDIKPTDGIYGWSTRHIVISRKITDYKFSDFDELNQLFSSVIEHINPAIPIELQSVRDLCDQEFGIGRLPNTKDRQRLFKALIEIAPAERIPRHRLIRELLEYESVEDVDIAIKNAIEAVGGDGPIDRYKVRLLLTRAEKTEGISESDRLVLVRKAYDMAMRNIEIHPKDKFSYRSLCDVALELIRRGQTAYLLDEALEKMRKAADDILDPDLDRQLRKYEEIRARMN